MLRDVSVPGIALFIMDLIDVPMETEIVGYTKIMDKDLLELFYKSNFYNRKEFEYVRVPENWIQRYTHSPNYVTKVAMNAGKVIASLGMMTRCGVVNNKIVNIGCLVDNCIMPEYLKYYKVIFQELLTEVEKDAKKIGVEVLQGWDFLKHLKEHNVLWDEMGYTWVEDINCYLGGSDYNGIYPINSTKLPLQWRVLIGLTKFKYKIKERRLGDVPSGIKLRLMQKEDLDNVSSFLNKQVNDMEFSSLYRKGNFRESVIKNNIHGVITERNSEIVGVLTYINTAWSGGMYGRPYYDRERGIFFSFIVDDFSVMPEYQNSTLPAHMVLETMKIKDPEGCILNNDYSYTGGIFDRRIKWMKNAFLAVGCSEPTYDYGAIVAKPLVEDIKLDLSKPWNMPPRCMLAPVPSKSDMQSVSQQKGGDKYILPETP